MRTQIKAIYQIAIYMYKYFFIVKIFLTAVKRHLGSDCDVCLV